jgi:hypothetical protein
MLLQNTDGSLVVRITTLAVYRALGITNKASGRPKIKNKVWKRHIIIRMRSKNI